MIRALILSALFALEATRFMGFATIFSVIEITGGADAKAMAEAAAQTAGVHLTWIGAATAIYFVRTGGIIVGVGAMIMGLLLMIKIAEYGGFHNGMSFAALYFVTVTVGASLLIWLPRKQLIMGSGDQNSQSDPLRARRERMARRQSIDHTFD